MPGKEYNGRTVQVIFPSSHFFHKWKDKAKSLKVPLSRWIFETVETSFITDADKPDPVLVRDQVTLKDEARVLRRQLSEKEMIIERLETENFKLKHDSFLRDLPGEKVYSDKLIKVLRSGGTWSSRDLLAEMAISVDDIKIMQIITNQLYALQDFDLVRESNNGKGWTWIG